MASDILNEETIEFSRLFAALSTTIAIVPWLRPPEISTSDGERNGLPDWRKHEVDSISDAGVDCRVHHREEHARHSAIHKNHADVSIIRSRQIEGVRSCCGNPS